MKPLNIAVLMDEPYIPADDPSFAGTPDEKCAEYDVMHALRTLGHGARAVGAGTDVAAVVNALNADRPDLVFNLTEQFRSDRRMDKNVAGLLELMNLPFTGTGTAGLFLSRNKGLCKQLLAVRRVRVPRFVIIEPGRKPAAGSRLPYPLVVKPLYEDGSDGISNASVVHDPAELHERAAMVHAHWNQPAIAEEFIDGRELYVGVLGNRRRTVLPPRELLFGRSDEGGPRMATYRVKWDPGYQKKWAIRFVHAELDDILLKRVKRVCVRACAQLQLRDYARVDLRVTDAGEIAVLEVNANPNIARDDEVALSAERAGIGYLKLIERIIATALRRYR